MMTKTPTATARMAALAAVVLVPLPAAGQDAAGGRDAASARAAVEQIFQGVRTADPELVRAVFTPEARFAMVDDRDAPTAIQVQGVDGWISAIGQSGGSWDERIYDLDVRVDGGMASVWAPYTFYRDGTISHCGINSIEMLHDGSGWKVTQISDTRRTGECPDPLGDRRSP